jgi:hypothetical protein
MPKDDKKKMPYINESAVTAFVRAFGTERERKRKEERQKREIQKQAEKLLTKK